MLIHILIFYTYITIINGCAETTTCERDLISFYLYTSSTNEPYELVLNDGTTIKNAPYIPNTNFKFIVHGYTGNRTYPEVLVQIRDEYFKQKPWNIIVVDWGALAKDGCYYSAALHNVPVVGKCCADLLKVLFQNRPEITPDHFHIIGFSLGAHVSASLSKNLKPDILLPRLTGLDPAFPFFHPGFTPSDQVLNREHAKFVDVLHTNAGRYGVYFSSAHYDIYANEGTNQPGCDSKSCNHRRAPAIFAESINSKEKFLAHKCDHTWIWITLSECDGDHKIQIEVGEHCLPPPSEEFTGTYEFFTREKPPFAIGSIEP